MERCWVLSLLLIIGIIGYFSVPTVANWIIQSGGMGSSMKGVNAMGTKGAAMAGGAAGAAAGNLAGRAGNAAKNVGGRLLDKLKRR